MAERRNGLQFAVLEWEGISYIFSRLFAMTNGLHSYVLCRTRGTSVFTQQNILAVNCDNFVDH